MASWPSGKAKVCNTSIPGSIPGDASNNKAQSKKDWALLLVALRAKRTRLRALKAQRIRFAFAARRSASDSRSEAFARRRACEFSPQARFREHGRSKTKPND